MLPPKASNRAWVVHGVAIILEAAMGFAFFAVLIPVQATEAALLPILAPSLWFASGSGRRALLSCSWL